MNKLFKYANSIWVRYSDYVITETSDGIKYLQPAPNAVPKPYDPVEEFENIALDAVSVGQLCMSQEATDSEKQEAIRGFALKYGLLGIMTAIPTTPKFLPYENVFFPKNHFIREESMPVEKYLTSVISSEMSATSSPEFLKAHAVQRVAAAEFLRSHRADDRTVGPPAAARVLAHAVDRDPPRLGRGVHDISAGTHAE